MSLFFVRRDLSAQATLAPAQHSLTPSYAPRHSLVLSALSHTFTTRLSEGREKRHPHTIV
jgi:hypothetical protein